MQALVAGVDIGTQGVRALACDARGRILAEAAQPLTSLRDGLRFEQDPEAWWRATCACLRAISAEARGAVRAIGIAATSGTVCLLDAAGRSLGPAIMYADGRAQAEARQIDACAADLRARLGYAFNSSWGLPKLLWLARNRPALFAQARYLAHAGDLVSGRLCGDFGVTDATQALKSGYDLLGERWPAFIADPLGLPIDKLPRVVASGAPIGMVTRAAAEETGLPAGALVVAGMTDGCASQLAAGAAAPGQWLSVLGTTLVVKGVSAQLLRDPVGRIYSHRHPAGFWLPGAASNTGCEALGEWPLDRLPDYDRHAGRLSPTGLTIYPLRRTGERFPFVRPDARGFAEAAAESEQQRYAATLEGIGYLERLGYALIEALGASVGSPILTVGGGSRGRAWMQIRADILQRTISLPAATGAAFGAAILAASAALHPDLVAATQAMTRLEWQIEPRAGYADAYETGYQRFLSACRERGYLEGR